MHLQNIFPVSPIFGLDLLQEKFQVKKGLFVNYVTQFGEFSKLI